MKPNWKKFSAVLVSGFLAALLAIPAFAADDKNQKTPKNVKKEKPSPAEQLKNSAEPDKVLYDRAMTEYKKGKYTEARLDLQTLINTYPDSEFLAKAKLGMGDSFYKEGGVSNLTQAVAQYKDFITFFPFLDEAAYAQMQVAMSHYRMMEKSDRDDSEAQSAEDEFQAFLLKFPNSPLVPKAEQHLREVQEVIADGDYRVAQFYYLKGPRSYRAAAARLNEIIERYPLYSQSDKALWMAGSIYDKWEKREAADQYYSRIVREYPSSSYVGAAKKKLTSAGVPVPQPSQDALQRVSDQKKLAVNHPTMVHRGMGIIKSNPDVSAAARSGAPTLTPPDEANSATDVLKPGAVPAVLSAGGGGSSGNTAAVQIVQAGSGDSNTTAPASAPSGAPAPSGSSGESSDVSSLPNPMEAVPVAPENAAPAATEQPTQPPAANGAPAAPAAASPNGTPSATESSSTTPAPAAQPAASADGKGTSNEQTASAPGKSDPKSESSSKKKKGIKKIIPW